MIVLDIFGYVFLSIGTIFVFLGCLGLFRMPDVFNKIQAGTKATTLGFLAFLLGIMFLKHFALAWVLKLAVIGAFILITNPIGSHMLARACLSQKDKLVTKEEIEKEKA